MKPLKTKDLTKRSIRQIIPKMKMSKCEKALIYTTEGYNKILKDCCWNDFMLERIVYWKQFITEE